MTYILCLLIRLKAISYWVTSISQLAHVFQFQSYESNFVPFRKTDILLTVDPWADVKNGFTWKIIIALNVRGGDGELKFS